MPKTEDVAQLIRTMINNDRAGARKVIEIMATHEREHNNLRAAQILEYELRKWGKGLTPLQPLPYDIQQLAWADSPLRTLEDLALPTAVTTEIQGFLNERHRAESLRAVGLPVAHSVLLAGMPGNGKTSLATAIASTLALPFLSAQSHALIDSHLGETSRNVAKLFNYAGQNPVVLFLDELDTLGSVRTGDGESAGKEYRHMLTTLLVLLDHLPDTSVIVGATNRPDLLDPALVRRFDLTLLLPPPTESQILDYLTQYQARHTLHFTVSAPVLAHDLLGHSWSMVERTCQRLHKELIISRI